jgi:DeoR/GlpR family transcriptional regulator of sugar metabolism
MTVITTSLDIASHFSTRPDIQLIMLGGTWDVQQRLFAGSATWHCWRAIVPISLSSAPAPSMRNSV